MQLLIQGKNMELTDWMRSYVEKKFGKLDRYLPSILEINVELSVESTKNANDSQICQATVRGKNVTLRAEERAGDMRDAIDAVVDKIHRRLIRYKGRLIRRGRGGAPVQPEGLGEALAELAAEEEESEAPTIVRRKRFAVTAMEEEEAIDQMELLGHDFFIFFNVDTAELNVVYKRRDGQYGLLQPRVA